MVRNGMVWSGRSFTHSIRLDYVAQHERYSSRLSIGISTLEFLKVAVEV